MVVDVKGRTDCVFHGEKAYDGTGTKAGPGAPLAGCCHSERASYAGGPSVFSLGGERYAILTVNDNCSACSLYAAPVAGETPTETRARISREI